MERRYKDSLTLKVDRHIFELILVVMISVIGKKNLHHLYYRLYKHTQTLNWDFSRHLQQFSPSLKPVFATIEKFQWFSGVPSPLNGMVAGNHWKWWFSDGFWVRQPLVTMVFDGCPPLVRRWNGKVPSSKSTCNWAVKHCLTCSPVMEMYHFES